MKPMLTALSLVLACATGPALAFGIDTTTLTPTISFPEPAPQPVTQGTLRPSN